MASKLDQAVKGAPPPNVSPSLIAATAKPPPSQQMQPRSAAPTDTSSMTTTAAHNPPQPSDPTALLPSSPPQIYLNLLILEASLRAQYLHLLSRRRQNTSALTLLGLWLSYFTYAQYFRPRHDSSGLVGGSPYWIVDTAEKLCLMGGGVLAVLFWATGQWERGVRWPRRWVAVTNRGLRGFQCKVVVLRQKWWRETLGTFVCALVPLGFVWPAFDSVVIGTPVGGGEYTRLEYSLAEKRAMVRQGHQVSRHVESIEEDVSPGGDVVKLLLLPKPFEASFRENWELFRTEFWDTENARRAELRRRVRAKAREEAKREHRWLWWTGYRGLRAKKSSHAGEDGSGRLHGHAHTHSLQHQREMKERKRRSSTLGGGHGQQQHLGPVDRESTHSRSSSRSSTITVDESLNGGSRRSSFNNSGNGGAAGGSGSGGRRRRPGSLREDPGVIRPSPLTPTGSRPGTPLAAQFGSAAGAVAKESGLRKQASSLSTTSNDSLSSQEGVTPQVKTEPGTP